jgi:serine/threonine-protein kinase
MSYVTQTDIGPYQLDTLIGTGETGDVYKATDTRLNRTVAIKVLKGTDVYRGRHEAQVIASMNNPHICAIYDIGDGYIVMEYVEGTPIAGPLSVGVFLDYATQIATALEAAHSRGVIHRDLKPANIIVSHESVVKLLDFGHAKQLTSDPTDVDSLTPQGTGLGTAGYLSPEQARGRPADSRSDIFSFGAILYEMLSGRQAFTGHTLLDVLNNIVNAEPRPLETTRDLRHIVMRCLCKDPADRFQSVSEIQDALTRISAVTVSEKRPSIAVLPFANLSADPENEYFSDGLTEEIITALSRIPGLRVTARTSAFTFRKSDEDIRTIAEKLNVETILEGSVRQSGTKIRVSVQLINAGDGFHLWSHAYSRDVTDIFEIQDDIAGAIARALHLRLYHAAKANIPAYECYLKARYNMWKGTPEAYTLSRECYEQAIALDPTFALAHSGYAENDLINVLLGRVPAEEAMPVVRAKARKALNIDPWLPDAHAIVGTVATLYDYDRHEAERHFQLAIARESVSAAAHFLHASYYLLATDQAEAAEEEIEEVLKDDPLNKALHYRLGVCRMNSDAEEASRAFQVALELDPNFIWAMTMLSITYWWRGMNAEGLVWAERAHSLAPDCALPAGLLAGTLVLTGEQAVAKIVVEQLGDGEAYGSPIGLMVFDSLVGESETAAYWLEKAIQQHCDAMAFELLHTPLCKGLSSGCWWATLSKLLDLGGRSAPSTAELRV